MTSLRDGPPRDESHARRLVAAEASAGYGPDVAPSPVTKHRPLRTTSRPQIGAEPDGRPVMTATHDGRSSATPTERTGPPSTVGTSGWKSALNSLATHYGERVTGDQEITSSHTKFLTARCTAQDDAKCRARGHFPVTRGRELQTALQAGARNARNGLKWPGPRDGEAEPRSCGRGVGARTGRRSTALRLSCCRRGSTAAIRRVGDDGRLSVSGRCAKHAQRP
jgi:hypothetical protein